MASRRRMGALELSFGPQDDEVGTTVRASSTVSTVSSSTRYNDSRSTSGTSTPLKRPAEVLADIRPAKQRKQLTVSYYQDEPSTPQAVRETEELVIPGETADDEVGETGEEETKPMRVITRFTIFDPNHRKELISLSALDGEDGVDRAFEGVGYVQIYREPGDDNEQDDEAEGEDEAPVFVRLGSILRVAFDYTKESDPVWIETSFAWYCLDMPSKQYTLLFQEFLAPRYVVQLLFSYVLRRPSTNFDQFMDKLTHTVDDFGHTLVKEDLWNAGQEIREALLEIPADKGLMTLKSSPLIRGILQKVYGTNSDRRTKPSNHRRCLTRQVPATRLIGNPDIAVLKAENQNTTTVTANIAALAYGLVQEQLQVVGPKPKDLDKKRLERQRQRQYDLVLELIDKARKPKPAVNWQIEDKLPTASSYVKQMTVDGAIYEVGNVVLVTADSHPFWKDPGKYREPLEMKKDAAIADFFWFAKIIHLDHTAHTAHLQWFEHGSGTLLQELANPQELFLVDICNDIMWKDVVGKVTVHWNGPPEGIRADEFYCRQMYDKTTSSFYTVKPEEDMLTKVMPPPDNCPCCARRMEEDAEKACVATKDEDGILNGCTYLGKKYHLEDFVLYYADSGPANIGYVTGIQPEDRFRKDSTVGYVTIRKVGRIVDLKHLLPDGMLRDERHLYLTDETTNVNIDQLVDVVYAPCRESLRGGLSIDEWASLSPKHFYVRYTFPKLQVKSWGERVKLDFSEHHICTPCWKEKLDSINVNRAFLRDLERNPLPTLDIFAGVGAFSRGLADGSKALRVTHAIEIGPSAAKTIQRNSPNTVVYNQCANVMLRYIIKAWEGHAPQPPYQLWDEDMPVPAPPQKGEIKAIVAGFPCQGHSNLNIYKKANDVKNNLLLNALSWIDLIRPEYVFLENVPGFLGFRLNATQASIHRVEGGIEMGGLKLVVRAMLDMGYQVRFALQQAAHYGTPQSRVRFILVGALQGTPLPDTAQPTHGYHSTLLQMNLPYGLGKQPAEPIRTKFGTAPHPQVTIGDAIGDLPRFDWRIPGSGSSRRQDSDGNEIRSVECKKSDKSWGFCGRKEYFYKPDNRYQLEARAIPTLDIQHFTRCFNEGAIKSVIKIPLRAGADYRSLDPVNLQWQSLNPLSSVARANYRRGLFGRLDEKNLFPTTVTNIGPTAKQSKVLNPWCKRIVTVRELARSQGFPDSFVFESIGNNVDTMHRQIGNAVPLPLARAIGRELGLVLFKKWNVDRSNRPDSESDSEDEGAQQVQDSSDDDDDDMYV